MVSLEVTQGLQNQTTDEQIVYSITTTNWGSDPSSVSVKAYNVSGNADVTAAVFPTNSPSVADDVITLSPLKSLVKGNTYRIEIKFTSGDNIFECYFLVQCNG
jgi:hypothetical protein